MLSDDLAVWEDPTLPYITVFLVLYQFGHGESIGILVLVVGALLRDKFFLVMNSMLLLE